MDELPVEIKVKLAKELSARDKINLRLINKQWRAIIDFYFPIENLTVGHRKKTFCRCFGEDELIHCIFVNEIKICNLNDCMIHIFKHIKRLVFDDLSNVDYMILLDQLPLFQNLTNLDINVISIERENATIHCPNLTHLGIHNVYEPSKTVQFRTPKLRYLKINCMIKPFEKIKFLNPESIHYLEMSELGIEIFQFTNLRHLHCKNERNRFLDMDKASVNGLEVLSYLPDLEEFHLLNGPSFMKSLIFEMKKQSKNNLKLFHQYVRLDVNDPCFSNTRFSSDELGSNELEILVKNQFNLSSKFNLTTHLDFIVFDPYSDKVTREFLDKFSDLEHIYVTKGVNNFNALASLLCKCKKVKSLNFNNPSLPVEFFNSLPSLCPKLDNLNLQVKYEFNFNFNFLIRFESLNRVELIGVPVSKGFIEILLKRKNINYMECRIEGARKYHEIDFHLAIGTRPYI